jgi:hypothetical protein
VPSNRNRDQVSVFSVTVASLPGVDVVSAKAGRQSIHALTFVDADSSPF